MNMVLNLIKPAIEKLTAPGGQFELVDMKVGGHTMRAYKNAPETLVDLINAARAHGDKEFLSYQGDRWSFDRFFAAVDALAGRLQAEAKLEPGDRIAIAMRNRPEWAVAFAAASLVGAIPAPINSFGTGAELRSAIETVTPRVLFCDPDRLKRLEPDLASLGCHIVVVDTATDKARGLLGFDEMAAAGGPERKPVALKPEDPALLLFTSGASTKPKAVLSSQRAASFPDVPTLKEQGVDGMEFASWAGLLAPKGTPKDIVDQLAQQMDKVMQMPDVIAKLKSYDYIPHRTSPQAFAKLIDADNKRWQRIVAETGFKIN